MGTRLLHSVTSILGALDKPALPGWAAKETATWAIENVDTLTHLLERGKRDEAYKLLTGARWSKTRASQERGSMLHSWAETYVLGGATPDILPREVTPYARQFIAWCDDFSPEVVMAEAPVFNLTYDYAGTLDLVATVDGFTAVIDYKTSDRPADAKFGPPYPEVALQLAAYRRAEFVGLDPLRIEERSGRRYYLWQDEDQHAPMPETEGAFVLVLRPDSYTFRPVRTDTEVFETFLYARECYRWSLDVSKRVIGVEPKPRAVAS